MIKRGMKTLTVDNSDDNSSKQKYYNNNIM